MDNTQKNGENPPNAGSDGDLFEDDLGKLSSSMLSRLSRTIETDIIPRLMLAFESPPNLEAGKLPDSFALNDHIDELLQLLLAHDANVATQYVATVRARGFPLTAIYLDLLAPAARRLGEMWEDDEASFTDVTIGVCRMHQVLLEFSRCFDPPDTVNPAEKTALIVPVPGEQHTFGLFMVVEFLRRSGWSCVTGTPATDRDLNELLGRQNFDAIGISVASDDKVEQTARQISFIRRQPGNENAIILVGGRAFSNNPELVERVGADAMARDGQEAADLLNRIHRRVEKQP